MDNYDSTFKIKGSDKSIEMKATGELKTIFKGTQSKYPKEHIFTSTVAAYDIDNAEKQFKDWHKNNNFNSWRERILNYSNGKHIGNSIVAVSPVKKIYAEYRFFVVDNNIVTYSQYKSGEQVYMSEEVPSLAVNFVKEMIEIWQPARAFVIDVAYTPDGYKIVEFNNINASGFYACKVQKIVESIEYMNKDI